MKVIGVIPARWGSTRYEGKPLADILGKTMIQRVYESAKCSNTLNEVIVATDDQRIIDACKSFSANVMMTDSDHPSGSDRVAEVARKTDGDIYVNIQGDEPMLQPENIDRAVKPLLNNPEIILSTLKTDVKEMDEIFDINRVKVVTDKDDFALYFSRLPIPFAREPEVSNINFKEELRLKSDLWKFYFIQIGLYVFRRDFLFKFTSLPSSPLEKLEKLEQLRALENGYRIKVVYTDKDSIGVDSPEDLDKIIKIMKKRKNEH
jgi:3-deoxy-manno-octulosonate cytidylyltransferase (CMP-KDO synthetase)